MKTRKVGKIVSLLVAIVLVATIMIPAAGVLADSTKYADVTWLDVSSFTELHEAIEKANDASAKADKTVYIRLTADITSQRPWFYGDSDGVSDPGDWGKMYVYSTVRMNYDDDNGGGAQRRKPKGLWTVVGQMETHDANWVLNDQTTSPYYSKNPDSPFYGMTVETMEGGFRVVPGEIQQLVGMGSFATGSIPGHSGNDEKIGNEYDERMLIVKDGTNVFLNLNGKTLKGSDYNAYSGAPKYQMSVINVAKGGSLTVLDLSNAADGMISGGTGSIYYDENISKSARDEAKRFAVFGENWEQLDVSSGTTWTKLSKSARYRTFFASQSLWITNAEESRGGGIYVYDGGTLNLESGKITNNGAWMGSGAAIFNSGVSSVAKGGGVYVEAGGTFNMYGGEISKNAARAYQKTSTGYLDSYAYGGGVYVEAAADGKVATFNMYGGKIAENATYAETYASGKTKSSDAEGAGIYVGTGSVCNIMGSADAEGPTTSEMLASFPQITNNSCGAITRNGARDGSTVTVKGAGIYCDGTLNIKKALVSSNDFSEFSKDLAASNIVPVGNNATHIMRDEESGLPLYIYDYNSDGSAKTYVTRLDARFTENLELATEQVAHETSGIYGTARANENNKLTSDGAGVYLGTTARMNVGERTWITGNYDLVTTGHKAFDNTRNYAKHWDKTANGGAGGYVYTGSSSAGISDGFTWSDTSDDVYLPDGVTMYKGDSLFESRIGVNYYDMVDKAGDVSVGATGRASNRVIVKSATDLDYNLWGATTATPLQTDIQFFSLNDNNKNYERDINYNLPPYVKDAKESEYYSGGTGTTARPMDLRGSENGGPALPPGCAPGTLQEDGGWPSQSLRDSYLVSVVKASDVEGVIGDTDWTYRKDYLSPYIGYIDFSTKYAAGTTWSVEWQTRFRKDKVWPKYNKDTYWMTAADLNPATTVMANKNVVFPQRAYQIDSAVSQLSEYEQRARFMDYKVIYDDNGFGSDAAPVLRFGKGDRQMYVTYNFDEADKTYYGENVSNQSLNEAINIDSLITGKSVFKTINTAEDGSSFTFYGANRPTGTLMFNKIVPDYKAYKASNILADRIANRKSELASITKTDGKHEDKDLYFKGWSFYTSYGYGPKIVTLNNKDELQSINVDAARSGSSLDYRGTFTADLSKIINQNVNAQPCPSMTATWYTKEELAEARKKVSNVMFQTVQRKNDNGSFTNLLRAVALAGSQYPDFDEVGFVISTTNATPTIEGGYDYVVKSKIYEKLGVNSSANAAKSYYDADTLLGGDYYIKNKTSYNIVNKKWEFTDGSEFAANVTIGKTGKLGYKDAGLFYANIVITDANKDTVYFVTPYAKKDNTYFYGESRAACYTDATTA